MKNTVILALGVAVFVTGAVSGIFVDHRVERLLRKPEVPSKYLDRVDMLESVRPEAEFSFFGDSHVERGLWPEITDLDIANFGIGGDKVAGVQGRIDAAPSQKIIVLIGINDLLAGAAPDQVADGIMRLVESSGKAVYLIGLLPVEGKYDHRNGAIAEVNRQLKSRCNGRCTFVETWAGLAEDGHLKAAYTRDGLHLNAKGYQALGRILSAAIPSDTFNVQSVQSGPGRADTVR